jgi:cell division protein FtsB
MVSRKRFRSFLTVLSLYVAAALLIGYFAINAYTGNHGLKAQQDIDQQIAELTIERDRLKLERADWQRRVALLQSDRLDPDMVDERARAILNYLHPRELTFMLKRR